MTQRRERIDRDRDMSAVLDQARRWLRDAGVVVVPTDTVYGLAADPTSSAAVGAIFEIKGRGSDAALPLVAASLAQVEAWAGGLNADSRRLAARFWPGPLSLIIDAPSGVVDAVHAGRHTVAIRVPDDDVARALCARWGAPLTATSANLTGRPPIVDARDLGKLADDPRLFVLDAGPVAGGAPSTIVDARTRPITLVRAGAIAWDRVLESLQE